MVHEYLNDFNNIGWKLHIPVVNSTADPLTKEICEFLNNKFGITEPLTETSGHVNKGGFSIYKVGGGGHKCDGSGMTIYGQTHTQEEMFNLAKELDEKFGSRILQTREQFKINLRDEYKISDSVTARFVVKDEIKLTDYTGHKGFGQSTGTIAYYKKVPGITIKKGDSILKLPDTTNFAVNDIFPAWVKNDMMKHEYNAGQSMLECIDSFGELVTGKMKDGIPQPVIEAFGPNFLRENPDLIKTLPQRVQKGNENFAKIVFRYIGEGEKRKPMSGTVMNLKTEIGIKLKHVLSMDEKTIKAALKNLSEENPKEFKYLIDNFDDLILKLPELKALKTPSFASIFRLPITAPKTSKTLSWVDDVYAKFKTPQVTQVTKPTTLPAGNKQQCLAKKILDSLNSKGGKVGLCIAGAAVLTAGAVSIFNQNKNESLLANNRQMIKKDNLYTTSAFKNSGNLAV